MEDSGLLKHKAIEKLDSFKMMAQDEGDGLDNYQISQEIGHGSFGTVYQAMNKTTDQRVAIKKIVWSPIPIILFIF